MTDDPNQHRGHLFINGDDPQGTYYAVSDKHLPVVVAFLESLGCPKLHGDFGEDICTYGTEITDTDGQTT